MHDRPHTPIYALPLWMDFPCRTNSDYGEELHFNEGGEPVDLTGCTFRMDVKSSREAVSTLDSFTTSGSSSAEGFYLVDAASGILQIRIQWESLKAMFDAVYPDKYFRGDMKLPYDIIVTYPDGDRSSWLSGDIVLGKGVTYD